MSPAVRQVEPVVEDDIWLQLAYEAEQFPALPVVVSLAAAVGLGIAEIKPQHIHLAISCQQFAHLCVEIGGVLGLIATDIQLHTVWVVAVGTDVRILHELRMVPVDQRMIQAHAQPLVAEGVHHGAQQVAARRRVDRGVAGLLRIPEAEPFVVLGGDDEIFHAGLRGGARPQRRIVEIGVEACEVLPVVDVIRDALVVADPLVPCRQGVQPPMDKEAETVPDKPARVADG